MINISLILGKRDKIFEILTRFSSQFSYPTMHYVRYWLSMLSFSHSIFSELLVYPVLRITFHDNSCAISYLRGQRVG
jgi:hypothetical protein